MRSAPACSTADGTKSLAGHCRRLGGQRPARTPTEVARKSATGPRALYRRRSQVLGGPLSPVGRPTPRFARVEMTPSQPAAPEAKPEPPMTPPEPEAPVRRGGLIEIVLS